MVSQRSLYLIENQRKERERGRGFFIGIGCEAGTNRRVGELMENISATVPQLHGTLAVYIYIYSFPGGPVVKKPPANAEDTGSIPGPGRSPEGGNGNLLQYSCLKNLMDREARLATVHGVTASQTQLRD